MLVDYTFIALCLAARSLAAPAASNGVATLKRQGNLLGPIENGNATQFSEVGAPQACGAKAASYGEIVAISSVFDIVTYCGRYVKITNTGGGLNNHGGGNALLATVADTCATCAEGDLGLDAGSMSLMLENRSIEHPGPSATEFSIQWYFCAEDGDC